MAVRRISSFNGAVTAEELLSLNTPRLSEIVLQHLKSYLHSSEGVEVNSLDPKTLRTRQRLVLPHYLLPDCAPNQEEINRLETI